MASTQPITANDTGDQVPLSHDDPNKTADSTKTPTQSAIDGLAIAKMEKVPKEVLWVSKPSFHQLHCIRNPILTSFAQYQQRQLDLLQHMRDAAEIKRHGEQCATLAEMIKDMNDRLRAHACINDSDEKGEGKLPEGHGAEETYLELQDELGMWSKLLEENARTVKWGGHAMAEKMLEAKLGIPDYLGWWQADM